MGACINVRTKNGMHDFQEGSPLEETWQNSSAADCTRQKRIDLHEAANPY